MPIIRKLLNVGDSRAVTLPKSWLQYLEEKMGEKIDAVYLSEIDEFTLQVKVIDWKHKDNGPK